MTDIERMAREAGFAAWERRTDLNGESELDRIAVVGEYPCGEALTRFAALVRAQALEDAARTCLILDALFVPTDDYSMPPGPHQCAAAIRALGSSNV